MWYDIETSSSCELIYGCNLSDLMVTLINYFVDMTVFPV